MQKYSLPHQIWRALYPPLIFIGVSYFTSMIVFAVSASLIDYYNEIDWSDATEAVFIEYGNYFNLITYVVCIIIFALMWSKMKENLPVYESGNLKSTTSILTVAMFVGLNCTIVAFLEITNLIIVFPSFGEVAEVLLGGSFIIRVVSLGIAVPVFEELLFRGIVLNRLLSWLPKWAAVLIGSALFGLIHFNLLQGLLTFGLGIVFSLLYLRYRSIWIPIVAHAAFNLANVILVEILIAFGIALNFWLLLLASLLIVAASVMLMIKYTTPAYLKERTGEAETVQNAHSEG